MGTQQFCLRWNNHQSNMLNVFDQLLRNEAFVDVTLACEGVSVKAHKMVLSACSPYFQNLFLENPCQHPIVILKDMKYSELRAIIDFMYKGEINVSQDQLSALLKTAETLKVKGLAEVSTGNVPNAGAELPNQDDSGVSPGGTGGSGVSSGVGGSGGSGGGGGTAGGSGAMSCASGSGGGVGSGGGASMGPGSPSGDGRSSPPTKRKRHRQGRRPSNGDLSDTGERSGDQQFDSEALARLKSEPLEPAAETHVEVVMEPPSQQYDLEVPSSLERCLSEAREREISLIPRSDGITTGSSSSGHGNLNQPQPSTSGTSQTSQDVDTRRLRRWKESDMLLAIEAVKGGAGIKTTSHKFNIPAMTLWRWTQKYGVTSVYSHINVRRCDYPRQPTNAQRLQLQHSADTATRVIQRRRRSPRTSWMPDPTQERHLATTFGEASSMSENVEERYNDAFNTIRESHEGMNPGGYGGGESTLPLSEDQSALMEGPSGMAYHIYSGSSLSVPTTSRP